MSDPARSLMAQLDELGVRLTAKGDRLWVDSPRGTVGPGLLAELRAHKREIIVALATPRSSQAAAGCCLSDSPGPTRIPISPKRLEANSEDGATQCGTKRDGAGSHDHNARPASQCESESHADRELRRFESVAERLPAGDGWCDPIAWPDGRPDWADR